MDEQQARRSLAIPPDLTMLTTSSLLAVPDLPSNDDAPSVQVDIVTPPAAARVNKVDSPVTPETSVERSSVSLSDVSDQTAELVAPTEHVSVKPLDSQRGILVSGKMAQVWSKLLMFWQSKDITLDEKNAQVGIMRTTWIEDPSRIADDFVTRTLQSVIGGLYQSDYRDQYMIRLEPATHSAHTTVYLTHYGTQQKITYDVDGDIERTDWVPREPDQQRETAMLNDIAAFLNTSLANQPQFSTMAPEQPITPLQLERLGNQPVVNEPDTVQSQSVNNRPITTEPTVAPVMGELRIADTVAVAWPLLVQAFQQPVFEVQHQNQAEGLFVVRYPLPVGGLGSVFSNVISRKGSADSNVGNQYQVVLQPRSEGALIRVLDIQGQIVRNAEGTQLINRLSGYFRPMN
jgi:uncharacterized lipoprotein